MSVLFVMLPVALLLATCAVVAFVWASRGGQFDDVETPPVRMLFDDTSADSKRRPSRVPPNRTGSKK